MNLGFGPLKGNMNPPMGFFLLIPILIPHVSQQQEKDWSKSHTGDPLRWGLKRSASSWKPLKVLEIGPHSFLIKQEMAAPVQVAQLMTQSPSLNKGHAQALQALASSLYL